jgi:uncharacterized membrane-anchored protein YhcB (DUF1043 family)
MLSFFSIAFWQGAVGNLFATVIGVIVGVPLALWVNSRSSSQQKNERKIQLIKLLIQTLEKNTNLIEQMQVELKPERVNFYNLDLSLLDSVSSLSFELIDDLKLCTDISNLSYELHHLQTKIELQLETVYSTAASMSNFMDNRIKLVNSIIEHLTNVLPLLKTIQERLPLLLSKCKA